MSDFMTHYGITGRPAPELRVDTWLANPESANPESHEDGRVAIADIAAPVIYLYNFQSWCPGCHSHGFPALARVKQHFDSTGQGDRVKFIAVQTVFEGHEENTEQAAREAVERHGVGDIALGHDAATPPTIMVDYRTGGTPWTVIIGPERTVLADGFQVDAGAVINLIESILHTDNDTHAAANEGGPSGTPTTSEPDLKNETGDTS